MSQSAVSCSGHMLQNVLGYLEIMVFQAQQKAGQSFAGNLENVEEVSLLEYL